MQKWTSQIQKQLNNLASFPDRDDWVLGDWIDECRVRPEVANAAALPLVFHSTDERRPQLSDPCEVGSRRADHEHLCREHRVLAGRLTEA